MKDQKLSRWEMDQALASARIEGHVPSAVFLADCDRVVSGEMTTDQMRAASLARALAKDATLRATSEPTSASAPGSTHSKAKTA